MMLIALSKERWRMALACSAVGLGLASVMILMALGAGARAEMRTVLAQVGVDVLRVTPERIQAIANRGGDWYLSERLRREDIAAIVANIPDVRAAVPEAEESITVQYAGQDLTTTVTGVGMQFLAARNYEMAAGRFFAPDDERNLRRVAVLGSFVVGKLNDGFSMLGERIWMGGVPFEVIGQFKEKGLSDAGTNDDDVVVIPYATARSRLYGRDYLDGVLLQTRDGADLDATISAVGEILRDDHHLLATDRSDFRVLRPLTADRARQTTDELIHGLASFFTIIALSVGGAGIFAVSWLNVVDRRAEIGLRIALGATRRSILILFVMEALLLTAIGAVAGVAWGALAVRALMSWTDWHLAVDPAVIGTTALAAAALGVVFGVLPAYKASRMTPVAALQAA